MAWSFYVLTSKCGIINKFAGLQLCLTFPTWRPRGPLTSLMQKNKKPVGSFPTYCTRAAMHLERLLVSFFLSIYLLGIPLFDVVRSTPSFHCVVFLSSFFIWWPLQIPPSIYVHIIIKCLPQYHYHSFSNSIILAFSILLLVPLTVWRLTTHIWVVTHR